MALINAPSLSSPTEHLNKRPGRLLGHLPYLAMSPQLVPTAASASQLKNIYRKVLNKRACLNKRAPDS